MIISARSRRSRQRSAPGGRRPRSRGGVVASLAALLLMSGAACGRDESGGSKSAADAPVANDGPVTTAAEAKALTIDVAGFRFDPDPIEVPVGATVTFTNTDSVGHTATADDGSFDLDLTADGGGASEAFEDAGTFTYFCSIHPSMTGSIVVEP